MTQKILCLFVFSASLVESQFGDFFSTPFPQFEGGNFQPFPFIYPRHFRNFPSFPINIGTSIRQRIEEKFKPMRISRAKSNMRNGIGGVTFAEFPGKLILKRDGNSYECLGHPIFEEPYCSGQLIALEIQTERDFCYSDRYNQMGNVLCVAYPDQNSISFSGNNGKFSCSASDARHPLLISLTDYRDLCGRLPWDVRYLYIPNPSNPLHVPLPNPDLECSSKLACEFMGDRNLSPF